MPLPLSINTSIPDSYVKWDVYKKDITIYSKFVLKEWNRIVSDIYSDDEWNNFLSESLHGGGWCKTVENTLLYYRGIIVLIQDLINKGLKVRTSCFKDNMVAKRFLRSVGFVQYKETTTQYHFWINRKRLINSFIYKRIYR